MINLVVEAFLYGKYPVQLTRNLQQAKDDQTKLDLWREREAIGKLYNVIFFIIWSYKRTNLFKKCQQEILALMENDHIYALIKDGGIR